MSSFRRPFSVNRYAAGTWANGRWVPGTVTVVITVQASLQPTSSRDMQSLPEGRRDRSMYVLFSDTPLQVEDITNQTNPDCVVLPDGLYEVTQRNEWANNVINHNRYIITRSSETVG